MYTAEKRSAIVTCHSGVNERHSQPIGHRVLGSP
jgi:hypothetical protein